ncbi:hypothetical protein YQE_12434, partial [Dendroctonus ponderosae]
MNPGSSLESGSNQGPREGYFLRTKTKKRGGPLKSDPTSPTSPTPAPKKTAIDRPTAAATTRTATTTASHFQQPDAPSDGFVTPRRTVSWNTLLVSAESPTVLANRTDEPGSRNCVGSRNPLRKAEKPPPIAIAGKFSNHSMLIGGLKTITSQPFTMKYTKAFLIVYCSTILDWAAVKRSLELENSQLHTYAPSSEKTHAFVLTGLDGNAERAAIKDDLAVKGLEEKNVFKMKTQFRPLFLVVTDGKSTVSWETRQNRKTLTQRRRCQSAPEAHEITECLPGAVLKCVNCGGPHRSFDEACPVYVFKQAQVPAERQRFVAAPPPARPAWWQSSRAPGPIHPPALSSRTTTPNPANRTKLPPPPLSLAEFPPLRQHEAASTSSTHLAHGINGNAVTMVGSSCSQTTRVEFACASQSCLNRGFA